MQGLFGYPKELARNNQIEVTENLPNVRFLFSLLPLSPPKHEHNAVSIIADEVW